MEVADVLTVGALSGLVAIIVSEILDWFDPSSNDDSSMDV